jgi:hypothetical protein
MKIAALLFGLSVLAVATARAQGPEIGGVVYAGAQRGATTSLLIDGKNLPGAQALIAGRGVQVLSLTPNEKGDYAEIKIAVAPDAPLGPREIRLVSPKGVSNPGRIWIDPFPQIRETEPNDEPAQAQLLDRTPVVVNGRIAPGADRDTFAIQAGAEETWVFDCCAARIRSQLDPVLELRDGRGQILKMAQSVWESDPRLIYRFEKAGRYFLTVRDTQYAAGANYGYLLTVGKLPVVTGCLPRGVQPGRTTEMQLEGVNLGATDRIAVTLPADTPPGEVWIAPQTANGPALPVPLLVDAAPVYRLREPPVADFLSSPPVNLDGAFLRSPRFTCRFHAGPQDHLVFDLLGRRIGSRIDGALRIMETAGKELAANDDAVGKDARLEFTPPAEGDYTLEARNVEEKTGPDCFYRLEVRRASPDFRLLLNDERMQVGVGGTTALTVVAERLRGFNAPITLCADGLPPGIVFSGGTIAPGQNSVEVTFTAPSDAKAGPAAIHLQGETTLNGRTVSREAVPREQYMPRAIDPGMFTDDSYRRPYREWVMFPLGVVERAEPFALSTDLHAVTLAPGQKVEIVVRAARRAGANGEIKLELRGVPDKVKPTVPAIAASQTEARITLTAAPDAPAALRNLILQGRLDSALQPAPAITLTVRR